MSFKHQDRKYQRRKVRRAITNKIWGGAVCIAVVGLLLWLFQGCDVWVRLMDSTI